MRAHPAFGLEPPGGVERKRDRWLRDDELRKVWEAADALGFPYRDVIRFAILTGQRRGEITGMRWCDLDWKERVWTIPRTEAGQAHLMPLCLMAFELLREIAETRIDEREDGYVFCFHAGSPLSPWGHAVDDIRKATGIDFPGHDLRRTVRTNLSRLGVVSDHAERVIGHVIGGVRGVYDLHAYAKEKRTALTKWERALSKILADAAR